MVERIFYFFYTVLILIFSPFILGGIFFKYPKTFIETFAQGLWQRLGILKVSAASKSVWIHAASLGECRAAFPFVQEFRKKFPDYFIYFSCTAQSGIQEATRLKLGDAIFLAPLDLSWITTSVLSRLKPQVILLLESELWPNWLASAKKLKIPVILVNGRISKRSAARYKKVKFLSKILMNKLEFVCAREELDAQHFKEVGLPSSKVQVTGNLKFDLDLQKIFNKQDPLWQNILKSSHPVWTLGSIRKGEENILQEVFFELRKTLPNLKLIFAPRHLDLIEQYVQNFEQKNYKVALRKNLTSDQNWDVLIWNTFGNLYEAYALADVVFVGGSLVNNGGQNPIEPAWFEKPVLFGPYMDNFVESVEILKQGGGALQVSSAQDLRQEISKLLLDSDLKIRLGKAARSSIKDLCGKASRATLQTVSSYLK